MAARLTRQEMKRDEVLETASRFFRYITEHTRALLIAVLAVLALILIGVGVFAYLESRQESANEAFAEALAVFEADILAAEASPDDAIIPSFTTAEARDLRAQELFEGVQADHSSASVGRIAGVYLARLAVKRGDSAAARELWESFVSGESDHMLTTEVRLNLLAMDRAEGKGEDVVVRLRQQIGSSSPDLPIEIALDQLATTLEDLGRLDEARAVYQRIVDEHPASPYSVKAQQRLTAL